MSFNQKHIEDAVQENIISKEQSIALLAFIKSHPEKNAHFDFTHVLYYLGGMIAIGAMTLFMTLGWESFGGVGILAIAIVYAILGIRLTNTFRNKHLHVPAAICACFVVVLTPLAIYGLQQALGMWPDNSNYRNYHQFIRWHWLYMELATLAVGAIIAWKYKYPFLIMPIAVTLWYLSMDLAAFISGGDLDSQFRKLVSMYSGLLMIGLAFWVDIRSRRGADYAFWIYLFGVIAFWGGLSLQQSDRELNKFIYFIINLLMITTGVVIVRRVFVIFGAIGSCIYIGHLAATIFKDSWLFPISLTLLGLFIVYLGVLWQKNEQKYAQKMRSKLPTALHEYLTDKYT